MFRKYCIYCKVFHVQYIDLLKFLTNVFEYKIMESRYQEAVKYRRTQSKCVCIKNALDVPFFIGVAANCTCDQFVK
jgi:hypothetical protein